MSPIDIESVKKSLVLTSRKNDPTRGIYSEEYSAKMDGEEKREWIYIRGVRKRSVNMINTGEDRVLDPVSLSVKQGLDEQTPQVRDEVRGIWYRLKDHQQIYPLGEDKD